MIFYLLKTKIQVIQGREELYKKIQFVEITLSLLERL